MVVVILAAGTGSRLGARTTDTPKPALHVGGRPLLAYSIAFARRAGGTRVAVVTGYRREIAEPLARANGADVILWNPRFADGGNLRSLRVARAAGLCDGGFLLMNADHVYRPTLAGVVAASARAAAGVIGFVDRDRTLGADDMKVQFDDRGRIVAIAKTLATWDGGYVGMTFVPAIAAAGHARASDEIGSDAAHVEAVLARLAERGEPASSVDVSGHGWLEVDDDRDLAHAEEALARDPWYDGLLQGGT